jgi:protein phosphatase
LGIPETEFVIEPYITKASFKSGEKYLICSDGLTDMVSEDKISNIMAEVNNLTDCADALLNEALEAGGNDNITLILCELL